MKMPWGCRKASAIEPIFLKFTDTLLKISIGSRMSLENPDEIDIDMEDESIKQLFSEAFNSIEEAKKITDRLHETGVSPSIPTY